MGKHLGVAYNLRLPPELKEKIAESAKEHNRSMNADIVARIEQSFSSSHNEEIQYWKNEAFDLLGQLKQLIQQGKK